MPGPHKRIIEPERKEAAVRMLREGRTVLDTVRESGLTQWQVQVIAKELKGAPHGNAGDAQDATGSTEEGTGAPEDGELEVEDQLDKTFEQGIINALSGEFRRIGLNMTKDALATGLELFRKYATHAQHRGYPDVFAYVKECVEFHGRFKEGMSDLLVEYTQLRARQSAAWTYVETMIALDKTPTLAGVMETLEGNYT